jgi:hypothetical protein
LKFCTYVGLSRPLVYAKSFKKNGCFFLVIMNLQQILTSHIELRKHELFSTSIISEREHPFLLKLLAYTKEREAYIWEKVQVEILSCNVFSKYRVIGVKSTKLVITPKGSHMNPILLGFSGLTRSYSCGKMSLQKLFTT